ncbi:MAG: phosphotriesterase family protein [Sagittula sp.]|uniref:phosphotriesterase family protein n=1 Tax=Sagittula sp. TaxID=2038081 RepID=UPI004058ED78
MQLNSVTGPVDSAALGRTLFHEHLFLAQPGAEFDPFVPHDRNAMIDDAVRRLTALREEHGIRTLVDPNPIELGRDVTALATVSERSGITILCATGFYHEAEGIPLYWRDATVDQVAALYLREIETGVMDTGIRAGVLKCATGADGVSAQEEKLLTAAARVWHETGVPVVTHTTSARCGDLQQEIFAAQGVDLGCVVIGHCCESTDLDYLRGLLRRGSFIGFDRIGWRQFQSDEVRADTLAALIGEGWGGSILLSQDRFTSIRWQTGRTPTPEQLARQAAKRAEGVSPPSYAYLTTGFFDMMVARGVPRSVLDRMLVDNTRRFLDGSGPTPRPVQSAQ